MSAPRSNFEALGLVAGFGLWSLAFVVLYSVHGYACGIGVPTNDLSTRIALVALFAIFLAAHVGLTYWLWKRWRRGEEGPIQFIRLASLVLSVAAAGTTFWTGIPVLTLSICA